VIPELKALEPQLKQILYNCVEQVKATKAALYLSASADLSAKTFELVTSYQYNSADRKVINSNDDLVDRLAVKRNAFYVNGLAGDQRFAEMQFRQGTDRMLATPLFSRGRLVGFIDMRDKAGKKPFDSPDLEAARKIGDEMLLLLGAQNLFGLAPVALVEPTPAAPPPAKIVSAPAVALRPGEVFSPDAAHAVEAAREFMSRRQHAQAAAARRILTESDLEVIRLLLPAALAIPSAVLASFTAIGHLNNPQSIVAIANVMDDALGMLHEHLEGWLEHSKQRVPANWPKPQLIYPFGLQVVPVTKAGISTVLSAPVNPQSIEGLVITVAFERTPEAQAQRALQIFLRQIEQSVETAIGATSGRSDRQAVAEKLLQPDFLKVPELMEHCREVATVAERFARVLNLPPHQVETIRIAALVHDVGMRLLDYERLYRRPALTAAELRGVAEHPVVGAAIVEPLLGADVAQAVLRHHERVDGKGYPSRMAGDQIPVASRIIQIADAWVAMTSQQSYAPAMGPSESAARLREGAGTQFDAALVEKFLASLSDIVDRS
jgi:HD domain/GAF domain